MAGAEVLYCLHCHFVEVEKAFHLDGDIFRCPICNWDKVILKRSINRWCFKCEGIPAMPGKILCEICFEEQEWKQKIERASQPFSDRIMPSCDGQEPCFA